MRIARRALLSGLALFGLLLAYPVVATAAPFVGSVTITGAVEGDLVGFAVTANPGLEKTITQPLPPFTVAVVVEGEEGPTPGGPKILKKSLDTVLVLTNTKITELTVELTLRDGDGNTVGSGVVPIPAKGTRVVILSNLLP
jgi:hypothetical protein